MKKDKLRKEGTKELKNLVDAADKYIKKHKGNANVILDVCAIKGEGKNLELIDDRIFLFGDSDILKISGKDILKSIGKMEKK